MTFVYHIFFLGVLLCVGSFSAQSRGEKSDRTTSLPNPSPSTIDRYAVSRDEHRQSISEEEIDADPFESINRPIFYFNEVVDGILIDPVTEMYRRGLPDEVQYAISRFLQNLSEPTIFVNDFLQAKGSQALKSFCRFMINTVFGVFGLFDVARHMGLGPHRENFNTTLKYWGVPQGPYIVVPILGPANPRFIAGMFVDYYMDPYNYYMSDFWIYTRTGARFVVARADILPDLRNFRENSLDYYAALRSFYKQYMDADHVDGDKFVSHTPGIEDFMFDDDYT